MVLHNVLSMKLYVFELLQCHSIVSIIVVGATAHVLEPHSLVIMDAHVVATVFNENVHDAGSLLNIASL